MDVVKIAMLGIAGVLFAIPLKKEKAEFHTIIGMGVCLLIFLYLLTKIRLVLAFVKELEMLTTLSSSYLAIILKMIGIAYVAEFSMNICKDAGHAAVANQIEVFAKISILVASLPILGTFIETVGKML